MEEFVMKTKSILKKHFITISLNVAVACMYFVFWSCTGQEFDINVQKAYELRMNGQADSAKVILEQVLSEDSTNAVAWYEIARTKHHMGLGNPRELMSGMADIQQTVQNAIDNDPDNVIYQYYKGYIDYFNFYISIQMGKENVSEDFTKVVESYKSVLVLKPDYHEAKLFLVELFGKVQSNMGGDSAKAEKYVQELAKADVVFGAKARNIVMPENAGHVEFWQKIKENQIDNADVHEALGKTYLSNDNVEEAIKCFEKAISLNSMKNILYVDLGRYYMMQAMQNPEKGDSLATLIENAFETYINSQPEPINPFKAFVIGKLAMIKFRTDDKEAGNKLHEEAMTLDPYYSKAFGTPPQILFDPPDEISHFHGYFFRPF
jgi:tetratricopeptide (TPR) repeat protein